MAETAAGATRRRGLAALPCSAEPATLQLFMRLPLPLLGCLLATGCAVSPTTDAPDADTTTAQSATALVVVERSSGPGDVVREAMVARFVRARSGALDESTLRVVGLAQDLPAPGTCTSVNATGNGPARSAALSGLELLDVGPLAVEGPQSRAVLLPRAMPDPAGVVSGVFYSARSAEAFAPGARLALRAAGGPDLDGFTASVGAPLDFADVRVAIQGTGQATGQATGQSIGGLDVVWDAAVPMEPRPVEPRTESRDVVYLDVLAPAPRVVARCTAAEAGHFVIPASVVGATDEGQIAVHRVHREAFHAKGVEPGEVRFDIARVVPFRR
jgi:hypothetical protein